MSPTEPDNSVADRVLAEARRRGQRKLAGRRALRFGGSGAVLGVLVVGGALAMTGQDRDTQLVSAAGGDRATTSVAVLVESTSTTTTTPYIPFVQDPPPALVTGEPFQVFSDGKLVQLAELTPSGCNATIEWGDGTATATTDGAPDGVWHEYQVSGRYGIAVSFDPSCTSRPQHQWRTEIEICDGCVPAPSVSTERATVPSVVGLTMDEAIGELSTAGFGVSIEVIPVPDRAAESGHVISQDPVASAQAVVDSIVRIVVVT